MLNKIENTTQKPLLNLNKPLFSSEKSQPLFTTKDSLFLSASLKKAEERTKNTLEYQFYAYCARLKKLPFTKRLPIVAKDTARLLFGSLFSVVGCGGINNDVTIIDPFLPIPPPSIVDEEFVSTLPLPEKKWTVLVYLDADNNLDYYAGTNIKQLEEVGSSENLNIVYLYDNLYSQKTGCYYADANKSIYIKNTGELNMGNTQTAKDFIKYAIVNFPAEKYAFIYWNHGGGVDRSTRTSPALRSVCYDETSNDALTEIEQEEILHYFSQQIERKVNFVGYDACLMGTQEVFHLNKDYVEVVVASQDEEPGYGWDYRFLNTINNASESVSAKELGTAAVNYFKDFYSGFYGVTLAAADLTYANKLSLAVEDFCTTAMSSGISNAIFYYLFKTSTNFSNNANDLKSFMQNIVTSDAMNATIKVKAQLVIDTIYTDDAIENDLIFAKTVASDYTSTVGGVSITPSYSTVYKTHLFAQETSWDEFWEWCVTGKK